MNTTMLKNLTEWIRNLKGFAEGDHELSIAWFKDTKNEPFSIIGGWLKMPNLPKEFCCSKAQPDYVMCVKIAENKGPYAYTDFEIMNMPIDKSGNVDDTCIPLEWDDNPAAAATFFLSEWERIMAEHEED